MITRVQCRHRVDFWANSPAGLARWLCTAAVGLGIVVAPAQASAEPPAPGPATAATPDAPPAPASSAPAADSAPAQPDAAAGVEPGDSSTEAAPAPDASAPSEPAAAAPAAAAPAEASAVAGSARSGAPSQARALDFCALKPKGPADTYQIQRVVFVNPRVEPGVDAPEEETDAKGNRLAEYTTLASIHAGERARVLAANEFPMQRIYTVFTPVPATEALFDANRLGAAELPAVTGGDDFAAYSVACADWIVVPKIARTGATWQKVKRKKTVIVNGQSKEIEYLAWDFNVGLKLELAAFQRSPDGSFTLRQRVSSGGAEGFFAGGASREPHTMAFHEYASTWPDASCAVGTPADGRPGTVGSCSSLEPNLSAELDTAAVTGVDCSNVDDAVGRPMTPIALCGLANAVENAVKVLQLHVKQQIWEMYTSLVSGPGIALGSREGAKRGDYYMATPPGASAPTGFARIISLGPGGESGRNNPSRVKFKTGDAPTGSRMTEYPLLGVRVRALPLMLVELDKGDLDSTVAFGGGASLAYDASSYLPLMDEFWVSADLGVLGGSGEESFLPLEVGLEGAYYLSGGLTAEFGLGYSALVVGKTTTVLGQELSFSGASSAAYLRAGLEHSFTPNWDVGLSVEGRVGSTAKLTNEKLKDVSMDGGSSLGAFSMLSLGYTL